MSVHFLQAYIGVSVFTFLQSGSYRKKSVTEPP